MNQISNRINEPNANRRDKVERSYSRRAATATAAPATAAAGARWKEAPAVATDEGDVVAVGEGIRLALGIDEAWVTVCTVVGDEAPQPVSAPRRAR